MAEPPQYIINITEWNLTDVDEVTVTCQAPLPREIHVGDVIEFTVTQIKRVTIERRTDG